MFFGFGFDVILCVLEFSEGVARVGLKAAAMFVEVDEFPPARVDEVEKVPHLSVGVAVLALAEVGVQAVEQRLDFGGFRAVVQFVDLDAGPVQDPVVDVDSVEADVVAEKLEALAVMLAVEFRRVHLASVHGESSSDLRHQSQDAFLVVGHDDGVIDKSGIKEAHLVDGPVVQVIEVVVHSVLPD